MPVSSVGGRRVVETGTIVFQRDDDRAEIQIGQGRIIVQLVNSPANPSGSTDGPTVTLLLPNGSTGKTSAITGNVVLGAEAFGFAFASNSVSNDGQTFNIVHYTITA